ncbi:MAG: hypothetical protein IPL60_07150 [Ardenticatenia bacterium]|nr:hypothetical protein [Ardenticatenia bacterium]
MDPMDPMDRVGAKAAKLQRLVAAGLPVPRFIVLPDALRRDFLSTLDGAPDADSIRAAPWPSACRDAVRQALIALASPTDPGDPSAATAIVPAGIGLLAVRSSMDGEDGVRLSFAGQLDSYLNVPSDVDAADSRLLAAIQACWASAVGERAEAYRRQRGLPADPGQDPHQDLRMGVILQRMVDARAAGVLFTMDPVAGDASVFLLSVAPGLGEDLVQGAVAGETLRLDRASGRALAPCRLLAADEIKRLWAAAMQVEDLLGGPQDIEFAFGADGLHLLQARPVTAAEGPPIHQPAAAEAEAGIHGATDSILWDNSNITESYAGVTTPLTLSLIRRAYAGVYRQFLGLMGVPDPDEEMLQNLLGFYHGQVYYQLNQWYAALSLLPAFQQNRAFMEQMMGVKQAAGGSATAPRGGRRHLAVWLGRMAALHLSSRRMTAAFHHQVGAALAEMAAMDLEAMTPRQLQGVFRRLETEVLGRWRAPILSDFMAMIFFGVLSRLSERWLADTPQIHGELLAAEGSMESLAPLRRVAELAALVRGREDLRDLFHRPAAEVWTRLRSDPLLAAVGARFQDYLDRYGDRCMNELKLEEPNLRDDPARLVRMVVAAAGRSGDRGAGDGQGRRLAAEARVARLPWGRRTVYRWVLGNARRYVRDRENQRFVRSRVFGRLRRLFGALGDHFVRAGRLDTSADIFYLTVEEAWSEVTGTAISLDLRGLVRLRRAEYAGFRNESWPERFETVGPPYWGALRAARRPAATAAPPGEEEAADPRSRSSSALRATATMDRPPDLQGMGCCSGRVTGRVRVVQTVDEALDLSGEILVAARTDPGWVFLFPAAAALLVERGSPLSHSAIVARELGLPAIVNIPGLTALLRTGDLVELDGQSGAVWLLERAAHHDHLPS